MKATMPVRSRDIAGSHCETCCAGAGLHRTVGGMAGRVACAEERQLSNGYRSDPRDPGYPGRPESLINILASLRRMAIGFGIAVLVSIPLGLLMGRSRAVAAFFNPLLMVIYPVPKAALMPIIMLWLGVGDITKTLVIFLGVSLPVIYHSFEAPRRSRRKCCGPAQRWGFRPCSAWSGSCCRPRSRDPDRVPHRPGAGADHDDHQRDDRAAIGSRNILFNALDMGQYDTVYAMIIIVGAMGICLDAVFERVRARLVRWSEPRFDIPLSFS